jgi:hypothetical protein
MFFEGLTQEDYVNIRALNREFIKLLRLGAAQFGFDNLQASRFNALGRQQLARLAATPFLLFSIQEHDEDKWRRVCSGDPDADLFRNTGRNDVAIGRLMATTVGFLWQLAQQNPYAVRMICGGSQSFCEMLTALTYFDLVTLARCRADLVRLRQAPNADIWGKLLVEGVRSERQVMASAHLAALQTLLTRNPGGNAMQWPIAACKTGKSCLQVADEPGSA